MNLSRVKFLLCLMVLFMSSMFVGRAYGWYSGGYANLNGSDWAPYTGTLSGGFFVDANGKRTTFPMGSDVRWSQNKINWMKTNTGNVAITFHSSYDGNTGPTSCANNWVAMNWSNTNLPGAWHEIKGRGCGYTFPNEIRVFGNKSLLVADRTYFAQVNYQDLGSSRVQVNVDTYWVNGGGNPLFHAKYCILTTDSVAC